MSDINTYSLNLNLDVKSNADAVLDDTSDLLADIQSQIDKMSSSIGTGLEDASAQVAGAISDIAQQSAIAEKSMASMVPQMAAAGASAESSATSYEDLVDSLKDAVEEHESITDELTDQEEMLMDALEHHEDIEDSIENQAGLYDNVTKSLDNNIKRLRTTVLGMEAISRAWGMLINDEERFVTANFRLHGTQREMLDQVAQITDEYGLMREGAIEAYTALASKLRVPQEELAELTAQVTKYNRITGSNVAVTAEWIKQMKIAGYTSKDTERMLGRMTAAMEEYGLSTQALESHTNEMTNTTGTAMMVWGEENVEAFQNANLEMKAWARELPQMQKLMHKGLIDPLHGVGNTLAAAGRGHKDYAGQIHGAGTVEQQVYEMRLGHLKVMEEVERATSHIESAQARQAATAALLTSRGIEGADAQNEWRLMMEKWEKAGVNASMTMEEHMAALQSSLTDAQKAQDQYNQSINTLRSEWKTATDSMMSVWMQLVSAIAPQIIWLIRNVLTPIIDVVKTIAKVVTAAFKVVMIVLYPVIKMVEALIAVFRGFWSVIDDALSPFIEIIDIIYKALFEGTEAGFSFADTFKFVGKVLGYIATAFIQPLVWLFKGVAAALRWMKDGTSAFGVVVKAVFFPLGAIIKAIGWAVDGISAAFGSLWESVKAFAQPIINIFSNIGDELRAFWRSVQEFIKPVVDVFNNVGDSISALWKSIQEFFTFDSLSATFDSFWSSITSGFDYIMAAIEPFTSALDSFWAEITAAFDPLMAAFGELETAFSTLIGTFEEIWTSITEAFEPVMTAFDSLISTFSELWETIKAAFSPVVEVSEEVSEAFVETGDTGMSMVEVFSEIGKVVGDIIKFVFTPLIWIVKAVASTIAFFARVLKETIDFALRPIIWVIDKITFAVEKVTESIDSLTDWFSDLTAEGTMLGDSMSAVGSIVDAVIHPIDTLSGALESAIGWFGASGAGIIEESEWLVEAFNKLAGPTEMIAGAIQVVGNVVDHVVNSVDNLITSVINLAKSWVGMSVGSDTFLSALIPLTAIAHIANTLWTAATSLLGFSAYLSSVYGTIASVISSGMDRIEAEAKRAWAIMVPLQFMAGGLGLSITDLMDIGKYFDEPIQAETISQVQVLTDDGGGKATEESKVNRWRDEQLNILRGIDGKIDKIGVGGAMPDLDEIKNLLAMHLPKMSQSPSKLGTKMNDWE